MTQVLQALARRAVLKLRDQPRLVPLRTEMGTLLREMDRLLPEGARPRKTTALCYRMVDGRSCDQPIFMWPDGRRFCYDHPEER